MQLKHMGHIWRTYGETIRSPLCSPFVRHRGKISNTTKSCVAHMLSNIWGNLWATLQHMGKCGHFCIQISPSVWTAYGEHTGNTPKATPNKTSPFPYWCSTLKDSQVSTKFVLKVRLLSTKMAEWILDRRPELMKSWLDCKLQSLPSASTWCCKQEVAGASFLLRVLCNDKSKMMYEELQCKTNNE